MAHVIQLVVKAFISGIKSDAENDNILLDVPTPGEVRSFATEQESFHKTINKVCYLCTNRNVIILILVLYFHKINHLLFLIYLAINELTKSF